MRVYENGGDVLFDVPLVAFVGSSCRLKEILVGCNMLPVVPVAALLDSESLRLSDPSISSLDLKKTRLKKLGTSRAVSRVLGGRSSEASPLDVP